MSEPTVDVVEETPIADAVEVAVDESIESAELHSPYPNLHGNADY